MISTRMMILLLIELSALAYASAFFWTKHESNPAPQATYYNPYQKRFFGPSIYNVNEEPQPPSPIPSLPIQVPLQAQLSPSTIRNVQLVPCLCPVAQDYDFEKQPENLYVNPSTLNNYQQLPQQKPQ